MERRAFLLLGLLFIIVSALGYFFIEPLKELFLFLNLFGVGYSGSFILFQLHNKGIKLIALVFSIVLSIFICLAGQYINEINNSLGVWLFTLGMFSYFIPTLIGGSLVFDIFHEKLALKLKTNDEGELDREDNVILKIVGFAQSTFFILRGMQLLTMDYLLILAFLGSNIGFFLLRGYAIIRKSNRYRYRSTVVLLLIPTFDVLIILNEVIKEVVPTYFYSNWLGIIPLKLILICAVLVFFGFLFVILRKMLLIRYELDEEIIF